MKCRVVVRARVGEKERVGWGGGDDGESCHGCYLCDLHWLGISIEEDRMR